jgi:hypothetical protein
VYDFFNSPTHHREEEGKKERKRDQNRERERENFFCFFCNLSEHLFPSLRVKRRGRDRKIRREDETEKV